MDLKQLVDQSSQLSSHLSRSELPHIQRGLAQIEAQTRRLVERSATTTDQTLDTRTAYLLANKGYNAEKVVETLNSINLKNTLEILEPVTYTDIDSYLKHQQEILVLSAVEQSKKDTYSALDKSFRAQMMKKWKTIQKEIYEEFGQGKLGRGMDFNLSSTTDGAGIMSNLLQSANSTASFDVAGFTSGMQASTQKSALQSGLLASKPKFSAYANVVQNLNEARLKKDKFPAIQTMIQALSQENMKDSFNQQIQECWQLLSFLLNEHLATGLFGQAKNIPSAMEYRKSYTARDDEGNAEGYGFNRMVISGGKKYLETQFWKFLETQVRQNRVVVGGMPSVNDTIDAFINLRFKRYGQWSVEYLDIANGRALWAHLFYLLRSGFKQDVLKYVDDHDHDFSRSDPKFSSYLGAWMSSPNGRLPKTLRESLLLQWNSVIKPLHVVDQTGKWIGGDPFRIAIYKILGRCEMNKKKVGGNDVTPSLEDYLWFQLQLVSDRAVPEDPSFEKYTLKDMATAMFKFGQDYFSQKGRNPTMWFKVLLLCAEFEKAVNYLVSSESYYVDAVHFAVAMSYYGSIKVPENPNATNTTMSLLISQRSASVHGQIEVSSLNFARMIQLYIRPFVKSDPIEALHYVYLIGMYGEDENTASIKKISPAQARDYNRFALHSICEVLLENPQYFKALIGELAKDGTRLPGHIQIYASLVHVTSNADYQDKVIRLAAERCQQQGRFQDAVKLYDMAGSYDKVLEIMNRFLSDSLTEERYPLLSQTALLRPPSPSKRNLSLETEPVAIAEDILGHYLSTPSISASLSIDKRHTCGVLIHMHKFMRSVVQHDFRNAIRFLDAIEMIPSTYDVALVQRKGMEVESMDENIAKCIPIVLLASMVSLSKLWAHIMETSRTSMMYGGVSAEVELKNRAKALVLFSATIKYKVPGDVYATLSRLEADMKS